MIKCHLSRVLGERRLKISEVSRDTGINRGTLTRLYHETAERLELDVLDGLCWNLDAHCTSFSSTSPIELTVPRASAWIAATRNSEAKGDPSGLRRPHPGSARKNGNKAMNATCPGSRDCQRRPAPAPWARDGHKMGTVPKGHKTQKSQPPLSDWL